jgi:hypothetical protein
MLVSFFVNFTWTIVNQPLLPYSLKSRFLPPIVEGESPCGQVDSLLVSILLRPRQKVINMDTDFLLDTIKIISDVCP